MGNILSLQCRDGLRKAAGLFAGLGHLQPLLLATTNSHYLLDRFCMERCCSSEYISRIVTSLIFMEILAIIVVRIVLYVVFKFCTKWHGTKNLNNHNESEEFYRGIASSIILYLIQLGYIQIFYAFTTGGRKGHMHWFYSSLLIQHFLNSLIAGSIGFWEVGLALWYLVTLPMAPIVIFFYQLMIHSWIRNNGPRDVEYIIVECQIILALLLSSMATIFWTVGYVNPYTPIELNLNTPNDTDFSHITETNAKDIVIVTISGKSVTVNGGTGVALNPGTVVKINLDLKNLSKLNIKGFTGISNIKSVKVLSVTRTITLTGAGGASGQSVTITIDPVKSGVLDKPTQENQASTLTLTGMVTNGSLTLNNGQVNLTIPDITVALEATPSADPGKVYAATVNVQAEVTPTTDSVKIILTPEKSVTEASVNIVGIGCYPKPGYYIYSVKDSSVRDPKGATENKPDIWAAGGKYVHATYYYPKNSTTDKNIPALLCLSVYSGDRFNNNLFYGRNTKAATNPWKTISTEDEFIGHLKTLAANGTLSDPELNGGTPTPQYNRYFDKVLWNDWNLKTPAATWAPLIMQGLSVGAVGSIFPNLIPKTLTCPKTTRTLSVINMFLVTVPHIFNVMLGDNDVNPASNPWEGCWPWNPGNLWQISLLLYIIYALAILFAIFNIHYPDWELCRSIRSHTWLVFLMILFTDVLNETFNAISRAGICSQKAAGGKKNHPCLHNKIACLMNLTYIPFWMTTTPMSMRLNGHHYSMLTHSGRL